MSYTVSADIRTAAQVVSGIVSVTPASSVQRGGRRTIGTTEVDINESAAIPSVGYIFLKNHGTVDIISVGFATTVYVIELGPGEICLIRPPNGTDARIFCDSSGTTDVENLEYLFLAD